MTLRPCKCGHKVIDHSHGSGNRSKQKVAVAADTSEDEP